MDTTRLIEWFRLRFFLPKNCCSNENVRSIKMIYVTAGFTEFKLGTSLIITRDINLLC